MQSVALENVSSSSGSVEDKLGRLERELTELATLLADMHGVIKTEEELQLYIERLQVEWRVGHACTRVATRPDSVGTFPILTPLLVYPVGRRRS